MLTTEQLELRRTGITGTDIAKIVGVSPYGGAIDVLLDKRGMAAPFDETERLRWGNLLEEPIRRDYAERHGVAVVPPDKLGTIRHNHEHWAMATPDGIVWARDPNKPSHLVTMPTRGLEIKTHSIWMGDYYGEPGTDEVPAWVLTQCAWNMFVCQLPAWDVVAFIDGVPRDYFIARDPELEAMLVRAGRDFYERHVAGGEELAPDGSEFYSNVLAGRFPKNTDELVDADEPLLATIAELREVRVNRKAHETEEERLVQIVKEFLGDRAGVRVPVEGSKKTDLITWKRAKDSSSVDWQTVCDELWARIHDPAEPDEALVAWYQKLKDESTVIKPGARRFCVPRSW